MKHPCRLLLCFVLLLFAACAATEQGPDDAQKTRLAAQAARWVKYFSNSQWDSLGGLYADPIDFNGQRMSASNAMVTMKEFRMKDYKLRFHFEPNSWELDSMKGDLYAGHLAGLAYYGDQDSLAAEVNLLMRLTDEGAPTIVGHMDRMGAIQGMLQRRYRDRVMAGQDFDSTGRPNYTYWTTLLETMDSKVGKVRYCSKYAGKRLIYAENPNGKMGVYNDQGAVVIPADYDDIGQIGVICNGAWEVRKGERKGLLKADGSVVLPVEYEGILPAFDAPGVAMWALKEGEWMAFDTAGRQAVAEGGAAGGSGPDWAQYLNAMPLEQRWSPKSPDFCGAFLSSFYGEDGEEFLEYEVMFRPPFILAERNVLDDAHLYGSGQDVDGGSLQRINGVAVSPEGNIRMLSEIETWGVGGRESFHDIESQWVVFEPELIDTLQAVRLLKHSLESWYGCDIGAIKTLGDTLMEVLSSGNLLEYWEMPCYHYFSILADGQVRPRLADREFPVLSVRLIDANELEGCFVGGSQGQEAKAFVAQQDAETRKMIQDAVDGGDTYSNIERRARHFRASDLDFMVNEVYAAHGYIFQKTKWKEYFGKKSWYKAEHADVEAMLTPVEKANIALIRKVQQEMAADETAFTKPEFQLAEFF